MSAIQGFKFESVIDSNLHQLVARKRILDETYLLKILKNLDQAIVHAQNRDLAFKNLSAKNISFGQNL